MNAPEIELLRDCWYVAARAASVPCGSMSSITLLGEKILLAHGADGRVFALRDFCPHRGIPLSHGRLDGCEVECCYHGWKFNAEGHCTHIPSLVEGDGADVSKIKARPYPAIVQDGLIWVYIARDARHAVPSSPPPAMPVPVTGGFRSVDSVTLPCAIDHAVIGLMDPAHGPFVHRSWWWRTARSMHEKAKNFAPRGMGFSMLSHAPSRNSYAYKILGGGGQRSTEISFELPGLRRELITVGATHVLLLTALTPVDATQTVLHQFIYSNSRAVNALLPLVRPFGKAFIGQDLAIVRKQQEGLRQPNAPSLMLLGDADAQALWYFRLKKEYLAAQSEGRAFENPLKPRTLRWRS